MATDGKASQFERVVGSVPQNKTAARVMSRGVHFDPIINAPDTHKRSADPLPIGPVPPGPVARKFYDEIVGKKFGHWRVFGHALVQPKGPSKGASWVVRCSCGRYEHRKWKGLKRAAETGDCCLECRHLQSIKARYREHGGQSVETFFAKSLAEADKK